MSTKQLKKKLIEVEKLSEEKGRKDESSAEDEEEEERPTQTTNLFSLLQEDENQDEADNDDSGAVENEDPKLETNKSSAKKKKKKRKKPKKDKQPNTISDANFDQLLSEFGVKSETGVSSAPFSDKNESFQFLAESELFRVDYRNFNPDAEMRRLLGAKFKMSDGVGPQIRQKQKGVGGGRLVQPKTSWPMHRQTGLSMSLVQSLPGALKEFTFEHGATYQQAQFLFWEAVDSMNPDAFVAILHEYPYHIDSLLQLSEVVRANDDFQMSRDLVERALYGCESAFHALFSVVQFGDRLDYRQWENRPFFLALFRHTMGLCQRSCYRTALEFAKLIFGLDPVNDPLAILLLIDWLALKAKQFDWMLALYNGLEPLRDVSRLPNFCYSTALAAYLKYCENEQESDSVLEEADNLLQQALLRFPTLLLPLLDKCAVEPDKDVNKCEMFGAQEQFMDSKGLTQLIVMYVSRCHELWKSKDVITWLERNVRSVITRMESQEKEAVSLFAKFQKIRRNCFPRAPRNIQRHVVMCELRDVMTLLPEDVRNVSVINSDPLPPDDTRSRYKRPEYTPRRPNDGFLTAFIRSLMPNYDPDAIAAEQEEGAVGVAGANLRESVQHLMNAMHNLFNDIELQPPPGQREGEEEDGNGD